MGLLLILDQMDLWKSWAYFQKIGCKIQEFFLYFCELPRNRRPELFYPRILSDSTGIFVCTAEQCHGPTSQKTSSAATPVYDLHQMYSTLLLLWGWTQHTGETLCKIKAGNNACLLPSAEWLPAQLNSVRVLQIVSFLCRLRRKLCLD